MPRRSGTTSNANAGSPRAGVRYPRAETGLGPDGSTVFPSLVHPGRIPAQSTSDTAPIREHEIERTGRGNLGHWERPDILLSEGRPAAVLRGSRLPSRPPVPLRTKTPPPPASPRARSSKEPAGRSPERRPEGTRGGISAFVPIPSIPEFDFKSDTVRSSRKVEDSTTAPTRPRGTILGGSPR